MPGRSANRKIWATGLVAAVVLTATVLLSGRWRDRAGSDHHAATTALSHVHGLAVNPTGGQLYVATHHGVVRMSHHHASLVGDARQDTMGFAVVGPDHFLASGHPAPGQPGPAHLGLIESRDGGKSWQSLSLAGQADFHVLRTSGAITYGVDSTSGTLMASSDRTTWDSRSRIDAYDLAIDPKRADTILATTERGVQRSTDGGHTWQPSGGPPATLLHWQDAERLYALGMDGRILLSPDGGDTWSPTGGTAPEAPVAFTVHGDHLFVVTPSGDVRSSSDSGANWQTLETSLS